MLQAMPGGAVAAAAAAEADEDGDGRYALLHLEKVSTCSMDNHAANAT
jgi:hypothetical protein